MFYYSTAPRFYEEKSPKFYRGYAMSDRELTDEQFKNRRGIDFCSNEDIIIEIEIAWHGRSPYTVYADLSCDEWCFAETPDKRLTEKVCLAIADFYGYPEKFGRLLWKDAELMRKGKEEERIRVRGHFWNTPTETLEAEGW